MSIDLEEYRDFVISVTSEETLRHTKFMDRMADLSYRKIDEPEVNWPQLLTAAVGLPAETGEFSEIIKKCVFQGKEMGESTHFHAVRELGDIMWYWMQAVYALNVTPEEVIQENIRKLEARYPGGFEAFRSENRQEGDI
jgi:NTP pyrophosphatase (non-canonical NTP hydrolase)